MAALPAGPRLPAPVQTVHYGLDPYGFFGRAHRRFGDVFTVRLLAETWVVLGHPDMAREVFAHGPDELNSGEANLSLRPMLGTRNVLLLDGVEHLRRRKLVLPPFHGERMRAYAGLIAEAARRELASWPTGRPFSMLPRMQSLTFGVILRAVFGMDEGPRLQRLGALLREFLSWTTDVRRGLVFAVLGPERLMGLRAFRRQAAELDAEVFDEMARRRADPRLEERQDILSLLLTARGEDGEGLSDRELRDELVTLLVAGHETTAALLAWAAHELARAPDVQSRLGGGEEGLADAVITETLRLRPPVPLVLRRLRTRLRLAGRDLPQGTTVAPCTLIVHRRADVYPEPDEFRPERFLDDRPPAGAWFPFGGGVRRCVGAAFAQFEARVVVEEVTRALELAPAAPRPERVWRRGIVLIPARGGRVVASPRR